MKIRFAKLSTLVLGGLILGTSAIANGPTKDIVDTAVGAGDFKTLVSLVKEADLVDTLKSKGPFTVLAPSDKAFAKLPKELVAKLMKDKALLKQVLLYHVIPGDVRAATVVTLKSAGTAAKKDVKIRVDSHGTVRINDSKVIATDVVASNGVIHVLDTVLIPPMK